jgi:hypothetical protein
MDNEKMDPPAAAPEEHLRIVKRLLLGRAGSRAYYVAETRVGATAMQRIADWLEKLGLGQYASVLPRTTSILPSFLI